MWSRAKPCTPLTKTGCCGRSRSSALWYVCATLPSGLGKTSGWELEGGWRLGRHLKWTDTIPISGRFHTFSRFKTVVDKILTCIHIIDFNYLGWGRKSCNDAWGTHQFPKILISGLLTAFSIVKGNVKYSPFSTYNCHEISQTALLCKTMCEDIFQPNWGRLLLER